MCSIQGHEARGTNDMIKTLARSSTNYITHNGEGETLENYDSERLKCESEWQD